MNDVLSVLFSALEFSSLLVLTLCCFRFRLKKYIWEIIAISISMSIVSFIITSLGVGSIYPIIQLVILIVLFKFIFKETLLYSTVSNVLGFVLFTFIELTSFNVFVNFKLVDVTALGGDPNPTTYTLQTVSAVLVYIVSIGMRYLNHGFGFIEDGKFTNKKIKITNKYLISISTLTMISLFLVLHLLLSTKNMLYLTISIISLLGLTTILIYLFKKRDDEQFK